MEGHEADLKCDTFPEKNEVSMAPQFCHAFDKAFLKSN